jgi:hypothetical protein
MIIKKVWLLQKPNATDIDATFLFGLGCEVEVKIPEPLHFETVNGTRVQYLAELPTIKITTTCEKQEMMLKLKYGEELVLIQVVHTPSLTRTVIPGYENINMAPYSRSAAR